MDLIIRGNSFLSALLQFYYEFLLCVSCVNGIYYSTRHSEKWDWLLERPRIGDRGFCSCRRALESSACFHQSVYHHPNDLQISQLIYSGSGSWHWSSAARAAARIWMLWLQIYLKSRFYFYPFRWIIGQMRLFKINHLSIPVWWIILWQNPWLLLYLVSHFRRYHNASTFH